MRLKRHLPDFINDVTEFKELDKTHTYELDKVDGVLRELENNQFINTANSAGLSRYEKMLNIVPDIDIDVRRFNILSKYNSSIPFTMKWLMNSLNASVGKGHYLVELDHVNYTLTISIIRDKEFVINSLSKDLRKRLPANLIIKFNVLSSIDVPTHIGFIIRTYDKQTI